ncbi:unnamed protein product [Brugia pahangi]|uniref:CAF1C_H4-bd domain-containing protein n=1 Tax=Brugia pahangi TaxID=6280 RepID=A0A0N4TWI5_BRUPA|nr:unnamed protein product [Brugia pahangi]
MEDLRKLQKPEFNVKEAEWAPLPESDDEAEKWPSGADWAPLPDDEAGIKQALPFLLVVNLDSLISC